MADPDFIPTARGALMPRILRMVIALIGLVLAPGGTWLAMLGAHPTTTLSQGSR